MKRLIDFITSRKPEVLISVLVAVIVVCLLLAWCGAPLIGLSGAVIAAVACYVYHKRRGA